MSKEKYIHGKRDDAHHEGMRSTRRRIAESESELVEFWRSVWPELYDAFVNGKLTPDEERPPLDKNNVDVQR